MDQAFITVWPLSWEILLLVVLREVLLRHIVVEQNGMRSLVCSFACAKCSFDFSILDAADSIVVIVDCGLENYVEKIVSMTSSW